jgi:prolipoprotein diacylglyceryl transferase
MVRVLAAASQPSQLAFIPSPPASGVHLGPLSVHFYGLMYVIGIALAVYITGRRWAAAGGDRSLVYDVLVWAVPAGIVGARIYFDVTTPFDITPHAWWGPLAVWKGGLGVWGGIAAGAVVGGWRVRRSGASVGVFMNAVAPALLVAQAIGRIGNYFNQELFGKPSGLPWALEISHAARLNAGMPQADLKYGTFQPSFLYELIFDLAWAAVLVWLGHHRRIRPQGLFALYVAGYSGYRIFEETIRIDSSAYFLGLRLNFFIAITMTAVGLAWFFLVQRLDISISWSRYGESRTRGDQPDAHQEHRAAARPLPSRATGDRGGGRGPLGVRRGQRGDRRARSVTPPGQAVPPPA